MFKQPSIFYIQATLLAICLYACSNSNGIDYTGRENTAENWISDEEASTPSSKKDYLPIDDTEYPYAGIPRLVIETENFRQILDRETEIPAKLQIWGEKTPESEIMDLTIRGRGNTSWTDMPKKSYKIEFTNKYEILGMPKDKDWALIANYADKTLIKNYLSYKLSSWLGANYTPRCTFVELYLNREYLGVYNFTETLKANKNRINWINNENSYLAEFDIHHKEKNTVIWLEDQAKPISVHIPKQATDFALNNLKNHLDSFNNVIKENAISLDSLRKWIDLSSYFLFYWIQEFSENRDSNFDTSVFFSWTIGEPILMGPLWDFDLAYNGHPNTLTQNPEKWFVRNYYWNYYLFSNEAFKHEAYSYWKEHRNIFRQALDSVYSYGVYLNSAASNNFKKWPILHDTSSHYHLHPYRSYQEAIDSLATWMTKRIIWIDSRTN